MLCTNIYISVLIHSVYRTHQTSDSKTLRARRKIEIQIFGHNIILNCIKLYLTANLILRIVNITTI